MLKFFSPFRWLRLITLVLLFTSCHSQQTDFQIIDMDSPTGSIDLKISDLFSDITIVPLETRDDVLLTTAGTSYIVTNHYILARTRDNLLQFDRNGMFIRTLANRGGGPNEFNNILNLIVDDEREILYYSQLNNPAITRIDLKSGAFLEALHIELPSYSVQEIDSKGNIYGFSNSNVIAIRMDGSTPKMEDSLSLVFSYHPSDQRLTTYYGSHASTSGFRGQSMYRQDDHIFFLSFPYSDTLFSIKEDKIVPQYIVKLKNLMTDDFSQGGASLRITLCSVQGTIISKTLSQVSITQSGGEISSISITNSGVAYLWLSKSLELKTIKSITIDPIAITYEMDDYIKLMEERRSSELKISPFPSVSGLWGYYAVEAYNMMELMDEALKNNQLSTAQRKVFEELSAQIDDDSNPVLIIGKIK